MESLIEKEIICHLGIIFNTPQQNISIIERLLGGMSHYTYLVSVLGVKYTYRKIGPAGNLYVNRQDELDNMKRIVDLDINNETHFFDVVTGVKVAKYVEGTVLSQTNYEKHLDSIVAVLKKMHSSQVKATKNFDFIKRLSLYESFNVTQDPRYLDLKLKWLKIFHHHYEQSPKVLCHNDAQRSNMVITHDGKLYLLDWEYAGNNDFYYDIASFGNVDFIDAVVLLERYLGRKPSLAEHNHIRFYRMFQALMWHQVAKYKDQIGLSEKLKINFNLYQKHYLNLALKLYEEMELSKQ